MITRRGLILALAVQFVLLPVRTGSAQGLPAADTRAASLIDADHFVLRIPEVRSRAEWEARRKRIREMVLLRAGLWPEPPRTPLNAHVFDERKGDGFTISKVYFESLPGFLATGSLYRPSEGKGPFPAVICPHGHWREGRLVNGEDCSIPARCIDFARMGFVVLSIDMIGFGDSMQFPHVSYMHPVSVRADEPLPMDPRVYAAGFDFPDAALYGFSLGGLQLWNAIRGVDFLTGLPEVDKDRIGATGASGGATQTLLLMTADDRINVAAPVNIIGAVKHPGCRCENFDGLWLETSTLELAAAFAPKPLLLMSATEDPWTNRAPSREYPMIRKYYDLYDAGDMVKSVQVNAGHNYNADTRAAVYEWFCTHLKNGIAPVTGPVPVSREVKALGDLRVFPDRMLPESARSAPEIIAAWKEMSGREYEALLPENPSGRGAFVRTFREKLALVLAAEVPAPETLTAVPLPSGEQQSGNDVTVSTLALGRAGKGDRFTMEVWSPQRAKGHILLVNPDLPGNIPARASLAHELSGDGYRVFRVRGFASGELAIPRKTFDSFRWSAAYNRDNTLHAVQDIITAIAWIKREHPGSALRVIGLGKCGIPSALACAVSGQADEVVVDLDRVDPGCDADLLGRMPWGAVRRIGDFRTAVLLLTDKPLTLLNPAATFDREWYTMMMEKRGVERNLRVE